MGEAAILEAQNFFQILHLNKKASHQKINFTKSKIYFMHIPVRGQRRIAGILQCQTSDLPAAYLSMPLFIRRIKVDHWKHVINMMQTKLAGWKWIVPRQAIKLLIKTILQSQPIYTYMVFEMPSSVTHKIDQICN